jgi:hypothetical protein
LAQPWNFGPHKSYSVKKIINYVKKRNFISTLKAKKASKEKKLNIKNIYTFERIIK